MSTYPLQFDAPLETIFPEGFDDAAADPAQWLKAVSARVSLALLVWEPDWPDSSRRYCERARDYAQAAIDAFARDDTSKAMAAVFQLGRCIEKAQYDFPIDAWREVNARKSEQAKTAGSKGGKAKRKTAEGNRAAVEYIHRHLSADEREGLTLAQWCEKYRANTKTTVTTKTMAGYLSELGYSYKGKRK